MTAQDDPQRTAAAVHSAVSVFTRRARESKSAELSLPERAVLSRLDRAGPNTTASLARWEEITPQAMGTRVAGLETQGLLARSPDPTDGRRSILTITAAGTEVVRTGRGQLTDRLAATLAEHFSNTEMKQLRDSASLIERLSELL